MSSFNERKEKAVRHDLIGDAFETQKLDKATYTNIIFQAQKVLKMLRDNPVFPIEKNPFTDTNPESSRLLDGLLWELSDRKYYHSRQRLFPTQ